MTLQHPRHGVVGRRTLDHASCGSRSGQHVGGLRPATAALESCTCVQVRKHADKALDVLLERQPENESVIRELKFKTFNQEWLDIVDQNVDTSNLAQRPHGLSMSPSPAHEGLFGLFDGLEEAQVLHLLEGDGSGAKLEAAESGAPGSAASGTGAPMPSDLVTLPVDDEEVPHLEEGGLQDYV